MLVYSGTVVQSVVKLKGLVNFDKSLSHLNKLAMYPCGAT